MFISVILGLILGVLLVCLYKKQKYHGPNSNIIKKNIYYDFETKTCFKLVPILCSLKD